MTMDGRMLFLLVLLPFLGSAITGLFRGVDRTGSAWFTAAIAMVANSRAAETWCNLREASESFAQPNASSTTSAHMSNPCPPVSNP